MVTFNFHNQMVRSNSSRKWKNSREKTLLNYTFNNISKDRLNKNCLYLCLVKINNKWRMKMGRSKNLYDGVYHMSFQYRIDGKNLDELDLPNIIPLAVYFSSKMKKRNLIKKHIRNKYKLFQTKESNISNKNSREIFEVNNDIFTEVKETFATKKKYYINEKVNIDSDGYITINDTKITITN